MRMKTMMLALTLLVNVNACANSDLSTQTAQLAVPLAPAKMQWAMINESHQLVVGDTVVANNVELLDAAALKSAVLLATTVGTEAAPHLYLVSDAGVKELVKLPAPNFLPETLCLAVNDKQEASLFVVDERGRAEQWLVYAEGAAQSIKVRDLPVPPNTIACDANRSGLFVVEEEMAIWRYETNPERPPGRELIDMAAPHGGLAGGAEAIAVLGDELIAIDVEHKDIFVYRQADNGWQSQRLGRWQGLGEAEALRAWHDGALLQLLVRDDELGHTVQMSLPYQMPSASVLAAKSSAVNVLPSMQTEPVERFGDAADDPAIWVHPTQPELSRILGTDKKHGLAVYDLNGKLVNMLDTGRLNNVDVRYGFDFGDGIADIAVATQRDYNSLSVYRIRPTDGSVTHIAELPTKLEEIYGFCMYQDAAGTYAIANGKSGRFEQYALTAKAGKLSATLAREFAVGSQPEGCVADDTRGRLFVGEEDTGVWTLSARADDAPEIDLVKGVDEHLVADVEGLALYPAQDSQYLIISSQGDDAYVVLSAHEPYQMLGKFSVGNNLGLGIDAISETDGLEVTHRSLGKGLEQGAFIAQDGHNVMPEQPQNFKLVPWQSIAQELELND